MRDSSFKDLVNALNSLPTIGKKSAQRLAYHMVLEDRLSALRLANAIEEALAKLTRCKRCHNISESELCEICSNEDRDRSKLCIVQNPKDISTIESSGCYDGLYYIIESSENLEDKHLATIVDDGVEEIIFAFSPSIANDMIILFIENQLEGKGIKFSKIAQGVPTGVELDNIDTISLARAMEDRRAI